METLKTHWKVLINPLYLGAYCVPKDLTVKITSVVREIVKGEGGKSEECTILHLEGTKPMILNRTNAKTITKLYGTPYIEEWVGRLITIFPTTTKVAGETVECLRIRSVKPTNPAPAKDDKPGLLEAMAMENRLKDQTATLRACSDLASLQAAYTALDKAAQAALVAVKDECKMKVQ